MNYSPFDIKLFELFAYKELTEGCIVYKEFFTEGCGQNHPITCDCAYMKLSCWVKKPAKKYQKIIKKTNSVAFPIRLSPSSTMCYDDKSLYMNQDGMMLFTDSTEHEAYNQKYKKELKTEYVPSGVHFADKILGHEPTITDVFRVAKEKGMIAFTRYNTAEREYLGLEFDKELSDYRDVIETYDITLSLLEQEDRTKEELIKLFS